MPRTKKTPEDEQTNIYIGKKVAQFREDRGLTLVDLAARLNISPAHLKSLESGRYNFNATLLAHLARELHRPVEAFFRERYYDEEGEIKKSREMWIDMFDALPLRERAALFDVGMRLLQWSDDKVIEFWRRLTSGQGFLISLEGIDGVLMANVGDRLEKRLRRARPSPYYDDAIHCWYNHGNAIWTFLFERFAELKQNTAGKDYSRAFERTLLFACERLQRQENQIKPALEHKNVVITPFFYLAPRVYQRVEGVKDPTIVQAVANFLIVPDLIIVLESDPEVAAERATLRRPGSDQFFSPYEYPEEFERAMHMHNRLYRKQSRPESEGGDSVEHDPTDALEPSVDLHWVTATPGRSMDEIVAEVHEAVLSSLSTRDRKHPGSMRQSTRTR